MVVAALLDGGQVQAQTAAILRGAGHVASSTGAPAIVAPPQSAIAPMSAAMTSASARALLGQANAAQAMSLAQQAQAAARASAAALNPNAPNGLGVGGLQPVANPVLASQDATGLNTWQGAGAPTQTVAGGQTTVTVAQTDPRAILSWTTFNVGANTTLAFTAAPGATGGSSWTTLNRVVGQIDPATGLRDPGTAPAPSQILGKITAPWDILILNPNGVLFSGTSQVNTYSLVATSLDIGQSLTTGAAPQPLTIAQRNQNFLTYGLLGYAEQASVNDQQAAFTFSAEAVSRATYDPLLEGAVTIDAGAQISSASTGFLLFAGPQVVNAGTLLSPQGEVALQSGRQIFLQASDGTAGSIDPNVRGFVASSLNRADAAGAYAVNAAGGVIEADDGYVSLGATASGVVINQGVLASSTSISRNGFVQLSAGDIQLAPNSTISITPDNSGGTIPQDPTSLADFKPSLITIGDSSSRIDIGSGSLIYAPSANVQIGAAPGATTITDAPQGGDSRIFIDSGAVIDVAGLTNVEVAASTNSVEISPVTTNDLQDSPNDLALLGATVFIDPRLSGVRSDGVAWVGSPIIAAAGFAEQVGVQVTQLMTKGGNVSLGVASANLSNPGAAPDIIVKPGATIDISGGWVTYDAGWVRTTRLIDSAGEVVDISQANPNAIYVGVYTGYTASQPRWGVSQSFADPIQDGLTYEGAYTEGHDAGSLSVIGSVVALDGMVHADAFAGANQLLNAKPGTATSSVYGDGRALQSAWTQLPAGGFLSLQAYGTDVTGAVTGGADVEITDGSTGSSTANLTYGQSITFDSQGAAVIPPRDPASLLPTDRYDTISVSGQALSSMGLSDLSLSTTGKITIDSGAAVTLDPGGVFSALAGRSITVQGAITDPLTNTVTTPAATISVLSGKISLTTANLLEQGSVVLPDSPAAGSYDVTIDGQLLVNGRWVNDDNAPAGALQGASYLNGGSISITAAPSQTLDAPTASVVDTLSGAAPTVNQDISGSILINKGALLDLSGGGYVSETGALNLSSKGGDLSLTEATTYFQLTDTGSKAQGDIEGIRVSTIIDPSGVATVAVNPDQIQASVFFAPGTIEAYGFGGGGAFSLTTPGISFVAPPPPEPIAPPPNASAEARQAYQTAEAAYQAAAAPLLAPTPGGTVLPLDFFNKAGFAAYDITSYKTAFLSNSPGGASPYFEYVPAGSPAGTAPINLGGYNALLATQVISIGAGQQLNLTQSGFSPLVSVAQADALRGVATGQDFTPYVTTGTPADAWDQAPVSLTLGGLVELHVDQGGSVVGAAGASLTVGELYNEGVIRLPGGTLTQSEVLPQIYSESNPVGITSLSQAFTVAGVTATSPGHILESAPNALGATNGTAGVLSNGALVAADSLYLLGDLPQSQQQSADLPTGVALQPIVNASQPIGVYLAPGSVTDLSGTAVINPRAAAVGQGVFTPIVSGKMVAGGTLQSLSALDTGANLFPTQPGTSVYATANPDGVRLGDIVSANGATIDVSGAASTFDQQGATGAYAPTPVWSNAGALTFGGGAILQNVNLSAAGGAPQALGATLTIPNLVLAQAQPANAGLNVLSADALESAGVATLVAQGGLTTHGDVKLQLSRGFFLTSAVYGGVVGQDLSSDAGRDLLAPLVSAGGNLEVDAPYIAFDSAFQSVSTPAGGGAGDHTVTFNATAIDVVGAVRVDRSVATLNLDAQQDLRLIGVQPWQQTFNVNPASVPNALAGQLSVDGDLNITAAQVYPTTGTSFSITSLAPTGTITFAATPGSTPQAPYSAGGSLLVQAANIVQGGVVRAPLGQLTLGSNAEYDVATTTGSTEFAPKTASVTILPGSVTSVSADGLSIPYGTTTDQTEWFFSPTDANPLTAPPVGVLKLAGQSVAIQAGAKVDLSGGGDVYAYEFVPGTGGSHDVLSQFNTDAFSSDGGYQYPDQRQVYAIVPGLSNAVVAPVDPIYSAGYGGLYQPSQAGMRVYLNAGPGLAAGWYTLLPAQYAMLPGGMRVVQDTSAATPPVAASVLKDGSMVVSGEYGVAGADSASSSLVTFDVQPQSTFLKYSNIVLTSGDAKFAAVAATDGVAAPRLPIDAGRLVLDPVSDLSILTPLMTTPGAGGRGAEADISGADIDIVGAAPASPTAGVITLTADELTQLNAAGLLIGGERTENADGTTSLAIAAQSITVENDAAHPLTAPEVLLAVDGDGAGITLKASADITAQGAADPSQTGAFLIAGGNGQTAQGAFLRVANGPERLVTRTDLEHGVDRGRLLVGDAVTLSGQSVLLDSSGDMGIDPTVRLTAGNLAIDADQIAFAGSGSSGLVVTPQLQAKFAAAANLTLRSAAPIEFSGSATAYSFNNLSLDTPGLASLDGGAVTLSGKTIDLANSSAGLAGCTTSAACGQGVLQISADQIAFSGGDLETQGFGGGVTLTAQTGVYAMGAGALDAGTGALAIQSPFVGDKATPATTGSTTSALASLTFTTTGAVTLTNPGGGATSAPDGTPGASVTIDAGSIGITGVDLRATAGKLTLSSATGVTIGAGAKLETPGYSKSFGDSADPYAITAPGGALSVTALNGDIDLASGATLSVGGGVGQAGELSLVASGAINLGGTLDASAPGGGGQINLSTGTRFNLSAFEQAWGAAFTGGQAFRSGAGDLVLAASQTITAANVSLTADGGVVDIAGQINVSGINGGSVALFGAQGVTLESSAQILAQAQGYASVNSQDTRQATGGAVTLGTDRSGVIQVSAGAVIDVSALDPNARLVPLASGGAGAYSYVAGDVGGSVTLRAPVVTTGGSQDVNINFAGQVKGAASVVVEGFEQVDLGAVAASGAYVGVTQSNGTITLDLSQAGSAAPNFLADNAPGTLVNFIQTFDLSAANAHLGGLTGLSGFSERPGVELDYAGNITLASNWNLGAGVVNVQAAVQAGLMAADPNLPGKYYVLPGDEAAVFDNYTTLTYRTGGAVDGQPGVLSIRAGGQLTLNGSITDGFFTFADQTDPGYVSLALGGGTPGTGARVNQAYLTPTCAEGDCTGMDDYGAGVSPSNYIYFQFPNSTGLTSSFSNPIPYSAAANAPDAQGSLPTPTASTGGGDPIGSAELFPLIGRNGGLQAVQSWSYRLVGGAATSADPLAVAPGAVGGVVVQGDHPYVLSATAPQASYAPTLDLQNGSTILDPADWIGAFEAANPGVADTSFTSVDFSGAPLAARQALAADALAFYAQNFSNGPNGPNMQLFEPSAGRPTALVSSLKEIQAFFSFVDSSAAPDSFASLSGAFRTPNTQPYSGAKTVYAPTLIRTGTGSIAIAASGTIDLRNGANPTLVNGKGDPATAGGGGLPLGGVAIYTAGHLVDPNPQIVTVAAGTIQLDTTASGSDTDIFANPPAVGYRYGAGSSPGAQGVGFTGILLANPVYAEGGGDVSLTAGQDVLGRRDVAQSARLNADYNASQSYGYTWIGQGDQPWRTGTVGADTDIRIDPQLFQEGVGTLSGGSVSVTAGGSVSDLSVVADTAIATAQVSTVSGAGSSGQALVTYGGGDVSIRAGGALLGGRVDIGSGTGTITVGGDVASAGAIGPPQAQTANDLVLRLSDAAVQISAGGSVELQGVGALGVRGANQDYQNNLDAMGFYSPSARVSIVADGPVAIDNTGIDVQNDGVVLLTPSIGATGGVYNAVYPGSFQAVSLTGDLNLATPGSVPNAVQAASGIIMTPSPTGMLTLAAAGDVSSAETVGGASIATRSTLYIEDANPNLLPGAFSSFTVDPQGNALSGQGFEFLPVLSDTPETELAAMHNSTPTHAGDDVPNRIYAGSDILDLTVETPKQARIGAGRDIINMVFFGQNLAAGDITRITAGRDITATTELVNPVISATNLLGAQLPAVQGDTFVIGGPGAFFLEAGRNLGPFLNSAVTNAYASNDGSISAAGALTYGGGVLSVGNEWNPWLPQVGADIYTEFGVGKGQDFDALAEAYLDPANLASIPAYLFEQTTNAAGISTPIRTQPIYAPILISWMQANAPGLLTQMFGTTNVTYQQAFEAFEAMPQLDQRIFLLNKVYFNELAQTSIPTSVSYLEYARGYTAVNTLFPASLGYTANNLSGGSNGASQTVSTGDLDLRLATIQTDQGGNILILGPGGRVLAGSTVSTAEQAARRAYAGGSLLDGGAANGPLPSDIASIPVGDEGILTLQGGAIYTFTDKSFLLNQSRLFTEAGGDIVMWSSNADLNAGEGPKTSADFPPIAVTIDEDLFSQVNKDANVTGAGIAAFESDPNETPPDVFLIAPRGTVDAGAAGVRVAGNLFIAANAVANADNFKVSGTAFGIPATGAVNVGAQSNAGAASAAAAATAQSVAGNGGPQSPRSTISVNIQGFAGDCPPDDSKCRR